MNDKFLEDFYFESDSTNKDVNAYIWFVSNTEINNMSKKGFGHLFKKYKPISELKEYMKKNPKHKIHINALDEVEYNSDNLKKYLELNEIKLIED